MTIQELRETANYVVMSQAELRRGLSARDRSSVCMTHCAKRRVRKHTMVSKDWASGFLARYPDIKMRTTNILDTQRLQAATQETSDGHFLRLTETLQHCGMLDRSNKLKPGAVRRIGNVDEAPGNQKGCRKFKALGHKGENAFHGC